MPKPLKSVLDGPEQIRIDRLRKKKNKKKPAPDLGAKADYSSTKRRLESAKGAFFF